jgi:hypothetical protein
MAVKQKMLGSENIYIYGGETLRQKLSKLIPTKVAPEQAELLRADIDAMAVRLDEVRTPSGMITEEMDVHNICAELKAICKSPLLKSMHPLALVQYVTRIESPFINDRYIK